MASSLSSDALLAIFSKWRARRNRPGRIVAMVGDHVPNPGYEVSEVTQKDRDDALAYVADKIKHQFDE